MRPRSRRLHRRSHGHHNPYDPDTPPDQQQEASLAGVVLGEDITGATAGPLAGASVRIDGPTSPADNPITTGGDGAFRFNALIPGRYLIDVSHPAHFRVVRELLLLPGEARDLEIPLVELPERAGDDTGHLHGVAKLEGQLAFPAGEQDNSGILVEVQQAGAAIGIRTVTNAAGSSICSSPPATTTSCSAPPITTRPGATP